MAECQSCQTTSEILARVELTVNKIDSRVEEGFKSINGRVRTLEIAVGILKWSVGLAGIIGTAAIGLIVQRILGG